MRKKHDKAFKARVALEALKEESTLQELATKYSVQAVSFKMVINIFLINTVCRRNFCLFILADM